MMNDIKKFSPAVYGLVIVCFFLPFTEISCEGRKVASFSGFQHVTGTEIEVPSAFGGTDVKKVNPEIFAIMAFLTAVVGLCLSFLKAKAGIITAAAMGVLGAAFLLLLKGKIDKDVLREGEGLLQVDYQFGFWLAFLLFLCALGMNVYFMSGIKKTASSTD